MNQEQPEVNNLTNQIFRFISENYVFYHLEDVPISMLQAHRPDLGIQILDLFNPKEGRHYKTFQFDLSKTKFQIDPYCLSQHKPATNKVID